jgi:hypothetical protein
MTNANARRLPPAAPLRWHLARPRQVHEWILRKWIHEWILRIGTSTNEYSMNGGERFRGKSEKRFEKSIVAAGNGPSIANQRLLQYVTWKGKEVKWTSYPALKCILNLIWSVRGSMHADSKKGNVEKILKIHCFRGNFVGSIRGNP